MLRFIHANVSKKVETKIEDWVEFLTSNNRYKKYIIKKIDESFYLSDISLKTL